MKKLIAITLVLGSLSVGTTAEAAPYRGPCRNLSVPATIRCAVKVWPVSGGAPVALAIAERESGFSPTATSPSGTYRGVFQIGAYHVPDWPNAYMQGRWWHRWFPGVNFNDPASLWIGRWNVLLAIRVMHHDGLGPWGG